MTRTRLPRPGEVSEECRLCDAALDVSLENPRRVCAACGEVNFPSKHSDPVAAPAAVTQRPGISLPGPPRTKASRELSLFWLGAASTGGTVFVVVALGQLPGHHSLLMNDEALELPLGIAAACSFVPAVWMVWRRKLQPASLALWLGGALLGYAIVAPVAWLLFLGLAILGAL